VEAERAYKKNQKKQKKRPVKYISVFFGFHGGSEISSALPEIGSKFSHHDQFVKEHVERFKLKERLKLDNLTPRLDGALNSLHS